MPRSLEKAILLDATFKFLLLFFSEEQQVRGECSDILLALRCHPSCGGLVCGGSNDDLLDLLTP